MFRSIGRAFRALDDFLTRCEEYTEERVWNGLFINDLKFLSASTTDEIKDYLKVTKGKIQSSNVYITTLAFIRKFASLTMQIQIVADSVLLVLESLRILIKYFAHYLFILITGLGTAYILLMTFKYAPIVFVLLILPLLFANHLFISGFFTLIDKKEQGLHTTLWESLAELKLTMRANATIFLFQVSLVVILGVLHLGIAFVLSTLFSYIDLAWSSSFLYWFPVVIVGLFNIVILYNAQITFSFAYPFVLQEKRSAQDAIHRSSAILQNNFRYSYLFYIILSIFALVFISSISFKNYEGGFMVGVLFVSHAFLLLGFILRRKYFLKTPSQQPITLISSLHQSKKLFLSFGFISYLLTAFLFLQLQPNILLYLAEQRPTVASSYEYKLYQNFKAGYKIMYPQNWALYTWNDISTTLYTNATGTDIGGIKVNIDVRSLEESNYLVLYEANPGLLTYDTSTKNVTTKIANVNLKGNNAVKYTYTYTNPENGQIEFQTHYVIRNGDKVYDIALVTFSKKLEAAYTEIFEYMVQSFELL